MAHICMGYIRWHTTSWIHSRACNEAFDQAPRSVCLRICKGIWVDVKIMVPFLGYRKHEVRYDNRDPKRNHNFDNHPYRPMGQGTLANPYPLDPEC